MDILVAFDGSDGALRAVHAVINLAVAGKPRVHLLHVRDPLQIKDAVIVRDLPDVFEQIQQTHLDAGMNALRTASAVLEAAQIPSSPHVVIGDAAQTIVQTANEYRCDMIAMGTRGLGGLRGLLLGSVATKVIQLAEVPVMLVK